MRGDTAYLIAQSQDHLNDLAKETLPFMYQISLEAIGDISKECHESVFHLLDEGLSVMYVKQLQEKLTQIENRQIH